MVASHTQETVYRFTQSQRTNLMAYIARLRTTPLEQSYSYLRRGDTYSAMGILCNLHNYESWTPDPAYYGETPIYYWQGYSVHIPPLVVLQYYGIHPTMHDTLRFYNDIRRYSFARIANILEAVLCTGKLPSM